MFKQMFNRVLLAIYAAAMSGFCAETEKNEIPQSIQAPENTKLLYTNQACGVQIYPLKPDAPAPLGVMTCLDATKTGEITDTGKVWVYDKINRTMSTCSIANELLFIAGFTGAIHCLDRGR